jgi:hypothetical protein
VPPLSVVTVYGIQNCSFVTRLVRGSYLDTVLTNIFCLEMVGTSR